jgi:hypothetical protein
MHRKSRVFLSGLTGLRVRDSGFIDQPESCLSPPEIGVWPPDREDRTSGRFGSHGFSRIRRVWLAARGFSGLTGCGFEPLSSAKAPPSPDFSPSRRSWRIGAPWAHGSTDPSSWVRLPLPISWSLSVSLSTSLSPILILSSLVVSVSEGTRKNRSKKEGRKK